MTDARAPHRSPARAGVLLLAAGLATASAVSAQDRFGQAVGVTPGGEVVVVKPAFGRGPAALFVFARDGNGAWAMTDELRSEGTAQRGENFGTAVANAGDVVLVASGDPGRRFGAYGFAPRGGAWEAAPPIRLAPGTDAGAPSTISLQTVMQILQPPPRVVAADGDDAVVSVPQGAEGAPVRAFRRGADGAWAEAGALDGAGVGPTDRYGAAVAVRDGIAAVGAPGHGSGGAVFVFVRASDGAWNAAATLTGDALGEALGPGAGLGSALAIAPSGAIVAGAPSARGSSGAVVVYAPGDGGDWTPAVIRPESAAQGQGFGAAVAAGTDELWIGVPGADESRGRVDRFVRDASGTWRPTDPIATPELEPRAFFGSAVALGTGPGAPAVVGMLGANGADGAAAIYEPAGDGWSGPSVVAAGSAIAAVGGAEVRCEDDRAGVFDCRDVDLQAYLPMEAIGGQPGERVSDAWGWTDSETGREYGLIGRTGGAALVDITDPTRPVYLGYVPANPSGARDLKVYHDHLFFTGDGAGNHGLVVFDLTRLRDVSSPPVVFEPDARFTGIASAHNLIIDTEAGFAYTVGTSGSGQTCGGGLVMIDIHDPVAPEFAGCYTDTEGLIYPGRTHDGQCVIYRGPDEEYRGRELCFASNETALRIVDVTDKQNPAPISAASYPGVAYVHQGWLTEDQRYFYLDDELDELVGTTERTRTLVWDVSDLDDPVVVAEHLGPNRSTDHNLYIKGDRMYQANYQAGLRVVDIGDPEHPREVGHFDTTPYGVDPPGFNGAWTAFPYFDSGTVLVTSMHEGVFLLRPRREALVP